MDEPKTKAELVDAMRAKRAAWEALLDEVGEARMIEPGVDGEWSVKDVIAHVTVYERWTLNRLQPGLRGEQYVRSDLDIEDVDERNAAYQRSTGTVRSPVPRPGRRMRNWSRWWSRNPMQNCTTPPVLACAPIPCRST